ncbi:MAG: PilZ domain-containing protein [Gammaproteobacteria bacterium]|nr:PilZ domain-containing protein [Gammaproteobacteria bacterium]
MTYYNEKRDFYRMQVDCEVSYSIKGQLTKHTGRGSDLSADGVQFITSQFIQPGTLLDLDVHPFLQTIQPLSAEAEVIRCDSNDKEFVVAVKMRNVS